ncbi:hypothetical protein FRB94_013326 [Tulasnella sp. JGI-2019a]|nr:hypothetical protein FRB93_011498 [Tulasnella sp. JGI-2019a]KAG9008404.1 hypothetical protein FRB94_013326 [Tulasnella sp. JGI-2019a]KAG9030187.1 hypothetical protein FRB95_004236 [Tulasnella sp. JGI-2019a]
MPASRVPLLFGCATFGPPGATFVRTSDPAEAQGILDAFFAHGYYELDTARGYADGKSEPFLAALNLKDNTVVDTKISPLRVPGSHSPENLRRLVKESMSHFQPRGIKIRVLYLHAPDRTVPYEETMTEIDKLHKEGMFEQFGLSNYPAWEVAQIWTICKERGYVLPTVYQGGYNILARTLEPELVPCLHKLGIRLVIYNPLAGGFLSGKFLSLKDADNAEKGTRFDKDLPGGQLYSKWYAHDGVIQAVGLVHEAAAKEQLTLIEVALRWLQHHSVLREGVDGVILGASSLAQLESNIADSEKGSLPESVLNAIEEAWKVAAPAVVKYGW